jgi:serine/threonine-protein kinase
MKHLPRERFAEVRQLFQSLLEESAETRSARLEAIAVAQPDIAPMLRRLLEHAEGWPEDEDDTTAVAAPLADGAIVGGRYRILRLLGEGGMGDVYLAERSDDIAQKVALKMLRGRSAGVIDRFVRERQILARLSHPHIAHLLDGGVGDGGALWFAMEYVDGSYVTDACDQRRLPLRARVALFVLVCRAVQFAHHNLVLHRDLKPSNILVDAGGAPKLLDFGIARLLDDTNERSHTVTMTPAYAAPEQLRGDPLTTASDVYQLGLVLCELLAGVPARLLRRRGTTKAAEPAPRLDAAFARLSADDGLRIARERATTPSRLRRTLRGDLQRIVDKALADDPRERYDSAQGLGDDLERWAAELPVQARRASFAYRARKLLRRHAVAATLIALFACGLLVSSVVAVNRAEREHQQRRRAETVLGFMRDVVRQSDPQFADGADLTPAELFERAGAGLEGRGDIDAVTRGALLNEIASVLLSRGRYDTARASAERAVALLEPARDDHPGEYLEALTTWLQALSESGVYAPQIAAADAALALAERTPGPRHWSAQLLRLRGYAKSQLGRLDEAEADLRAAIAAFQDGGAQDPNLESTWNDLANVAGARGDLRAALALYQRALAALDTNAGSTFGTSKFNRLVTQSNIAVMHHRLGETRTAIALLEPLIGQSEALLGAAHDRTLSMRNLLVQAYAGVGDYAHAQAALATNRQRAHEAVAMKPNTRFELDMVGAKMDLLLLHPDRALPVLRAGAQAQHADAQPPNLRRARIDGLLGEALAQSRRCEEALPLFTRALADAGEAAGGQPNTVTGEIEDGIGRCLIAQGDPAAAQPHFQRAAEAFRATHGADTVSVLRSRIHAAWSEALAGDAAAPKQLTALRSELVAQLGGEDRPQVWQLDLLLDDLERRSGRPGIEAARRDRAVAGLKALAGTPERPYFLGLNGFS